jgi:hypothetical protein
MRQVYRFIIMEILSTTIYNEILQIFTPRAVSANVTHVTAIKFTNLPQQKEDIH